MPVENDVDVAQATRTMSVAATFAQALNSLQRGRAAQAGALCAEVLRQQPQHADALHLLGVLALQQGKPADGIQWLRKSVHANPRHALAHCNLGNALRDAGQPSAAVESYRQALSLAPNFAGACFGMGNAYMDLRFVEDALRSFDQAIALQPNYAEAHNNRGNALEALGRIDDALRSFRRALEYRPHFDLALDNCAKVLLQSDQCEEALVVLNRLLSLQPTDAETHCRLGQCLMRLDRTGEALTSFDRAIALKKDYVEALYGRGVALRMAKRHREALHDFERASKVMPESVDILYRKAEALRDLSRPAEAALAFARVLELQPQRNYALGNLMHARLQICDWTDYEVNVERAVEAVAAGKRAYLPGAFLSISHSADLQRRCAELFAQPFEPAARPVLWNGEIYAHDRIRVAYISADFHEHPVSVLLVGVLEHHDRRRFEIAGLSLAPEDGSPLGCRIKEAFDRFDDVSRMTDAQIARLMREREIDIAVDLMGLSGGGRPAIYSYRAAPVQVSFLGFPGTTALPGMDYLIGDNVVIPPTEQRHYTEHVTYLPEGYQPGDANRPIGGAIPTRAECGLPHEGLVFCCFNTHYKISPMFFAAWMRLLRSVPESVLWLSAGLPAARDNLRRAAAQRGVAPERLIFAPRLPSAEDHLARYRLADLFLDTSPFNAHATASDALWAGVPVITCLGGTFAGRVAASLLTAIGASELITQTLDEYEALAVRLATTPTLLDELRCRLSRNRGTHPLFDTGRYCRHLEAAYSTMWLKMQRHEQPVGFAVAALPSP
jgi:protein O-GlcNAc transferase